MISASPRDTLPKKRWPALTNSPGANSRSWEERGGGRPMFGGGPASGARGGRPAAGGGGGGGPASGDGGVGCAAAPKGPMQASSSASVANLRTVGMEDSRNGRLTRCSRPGPRFSEIGPESNHHSQQL